MPALTAEEKVSRAEAPVREEFVRRAGRVKVDAVAGSLAAAPAAAAAAAPTNDSKAGGGGGQQPAAQKKSKNQLKKERSQQRYSKAELCNGFVQGSCRFGADCRFNHDVAAYLQTKPPDLPGACPFDSTGTCLYGVTCRWASKHRFADAAAQQAAQGGEGAAAAEAGAGDMAVDGAPPAVVPEPAANEGQAAAPEGQQEQVGQPQPQQNGATADAAAAAGAQQQGAEGDWWYRGDGTIPTRIVGHLQPEAPIQEALNVLTKDNQALLRKDQYDFSHADGVLAAMGIKNTRAKARQQQRNEQREQRAQQAGATGAANGSAATGDPEATVEEGPGAAAGPPDAKRPRLDPEAAAPAAPAEPAEPAAPPGSDAGFLAGLGEGAAGEAPAAAAGAAPSTTNAAAAVAAAPPSTQQQQGQGDYVETRAQPREKRTLDFTDKLYLAPLTTVGNLPFRRLCKGLGADITCGEMALATNLLQGQASEWALLKRHPSEDCFGVQVCGGYPDSMARCAQLIEDTCEVDFVDCNFGCPIDVVCGRGGGAACLLRPRHMEQIVRSMSSILSCPVTFKMRKGYIDGQDIAHTIVPKAKAWGASAITLHGRTRDQRYSKLADWEYIQRCAGLAPEGLQLVGNGDCFSYTDYLRCLENEGGEGGRHLAAIYIARGALVKPWIFTEIKERRHWDISAGERLDLLRGFVGMGLEHWGSDSRGVETTRRFLLEWLSFTHRYIPLGLLEVVPQQLHWRPPGFVGRSDLETLLASDNAADWVRISEMLLGPAPPGFAFNPKHKANSYARQEGANVKISNYD